MGAEGAQGTGEGVRREEGAPLIKKLVAAFTGRGFSSGLLAFGKVDGRSSGRKMSSPVCRKLCKENFPPNR